MKWGLFSLLVIILASNAVHSAIVSETSWATLGQGLFSVEGMDQVECQEVSLNLDSTFQQPGIFSILTIVAEFGPVSEGAARIFVHVNSDSNQLPAATRTLELTTADFNAKPYHALFDQNWLVVGANQIKICPQTSGSITRIKIAPDTRFGLYRMPYFNPLHFTKTIDRENPIVGQEAMISIKAKNTGSEDASVKIEFRDLELRVLQITRGDSDFDGVIKAGQEITLTYFVKPRFAAHMTPVSAKLTYTDVFGETVVVKSTRPQFQVIEQPFSVTGLLIAPQKSARPHESIPLQLSVKNTGENELFNVSVSLKNVKDLTQSPSSWEISSIKGGETKILSTQISSEKEGKFTLSCVIESEAGSQSVSCDQINVSFENETQNPALLLIVGLLVIGALIYAYIYHVPSKKESKP